MIPEHRCAQCFVAQYGMKSDIPCRNEWWPEWDAMQAQVVAA